MTELTKHDICRQTSSEPLPVDCRSAGQVTQLCVDHTANSNTHNYRVRQKQTRHTASTSMYSLYSEYKHVLANILRSRYVARTPPLEARSPGCHSNVENASIDGQSPASQPRILAIYGAQFWERLRHLLVTNQQRAHTPRKLGFALCCHSNATRAPIANPPNSAQLGGSLYHAAKLHPGPCSSVGVQPRTDRQTHSRAWPQYILCHLWLMQNVITT